MIIILKRCIKFYIRDPHFFLKFIIFGISRLYFPQKEIMCVYVCVFLIQDKKQDAN